MSQIVINWALAMISGLIGFFAHLSWMAIRDLQKAQSRLQTRVAEVEVLVAGDYLRKQEFEKFVDRVIAKLDAIDDKIDRKADK
jgi:hypothetical protein